jgi:hypothetical protein
MSAFTPSDQFSLYDDEKLMKLAKFYPKDFRDDELDHLEQELCLYLDNVLNDTRFASLDTISDLAKLMVTTRKHLSYPLVYRLLKLVLTLPVATATVERCFSTMKLLKSALRNKMGDDYMSNSLICFVEKELLDNIPNEVIVKRFHATNHRGIKRKVMFSGFYYLVSVLVLIFSFEFDILCFLHYRLETRNCTKKHQPCVHAYQKTSQSEVFPFRT